jgi:hypothetical protein
LNKKIRLELGDNDSQVNTICTCILPTENNYCVKPREYLFLKLHLYPGENKKQKTKQNNGMEWND